MRLNSAYIFGIALAAACLVLELMSGCHSPVVGRRAPSTSVTRVLDLGFATRVPGRPSEPSWQIDDKVSKPIPLLSRSP